LCSASAASFAKALALSADQPLRYVPFGISCPLMYGAAVGAASASPNDTPESSISHTLVIGGSVALLPLVLVVLGVVGDGSAAGVLDGLGDALLVGIAGALEDAGMACGVTAGG